MRVKAGGAVDALLPEGCGGEVWHGPQASAQPATRRFQ
jgi:hypothetical protein